MGNLDDIYIDPTLEAMHRAVERAEAGKPPRTYLGASSIGHPCERSLWYGLNGAKAKPMSASGIYATSDGHRVEDVIADRLRMVEGVELWTVDEHGKQFGFSDGNFSGHCDGVILGLIQAPKTPHVWEHKAVNEKKFTEFGKLRLKHGEKNTLREWDWQYFVQAQIYMHYFGLTRHYITVSTPGGRQITSARTEYNKDIAEAHVAKAHRILSLKEPPARAWDNPSYYRCQWCRFHEVCYA